MLNVTKELTALARKLGYTGKAPDTVAKAINAITSVAGESSGSGGGDGGITFIPVEYDENEYTYTATKTAGEIKTIMATSFPVFTYAGEDEMWTEPVLSYKVIDEVIQISVSSPGMGMLFTADSESDYPTYED